jgi:hypothetical protein
MATPLYIVVPVEVDALVVNNKVRIGQNFQRWSMNYQNLQYFLSPEPAPFTGNANDFNQNPKNNGVYLQWALPSALAQGQQDSVQGTTTFPLVPNRWLVVRYSGALSNRIATGWVVESDFLDPNLGTSPYLDPFSSTVKVTSIGRQVSLANGPYNDTSTQPLFLTAVAPGLATFSAYQPYNENVFSIHDPLTSVADVDTLSYFIAGWYSDPSKDILADFPDLPSALAALNWEMADKATGPGNGSIYYGSVQGVQWDLNGPIPPSNRPDGSKVKLAVGNTSIDALTALIAFQAAGDPQIDPQLLEAFQYDLLGVIDRPDGEAQLAQDIHTAWFQAYDGGSIWEIVDALGATGKGPDQSELKREAQWLADLNKAQADYDDALRSLVSLQWQLYILWWKQGNAAAVSPAPSDMTPAQFAAQVDPNTANSLAWQVQQQITSVAQSQKNIPWGATQQDLLTATGSYAASKNLPAARELKRGTLSSYHRANNPVVLLAGAGAPGIAPTGDALICRFPSQVVTGFNYTSGPIDAKSMQNQIPTPNLDNLPVIMAALIVEFFFLDPNNATLVAKVALGTTDPPIIDAVKARMADAQQYAIGVLPAINLAPWVQPWSPLYLMWQVWYYPISYGSNQQPDWTFNDQTYDWTGDGAILTPLAYSGRIFLTPQAVFNLQAKIEKYLAQNPNADVKALEDFITQTDKWDLISQALDGFTEGLALIDPASNVSVMGPTAQLVGPNGTYVPNPGARTKVPFKGWPPSNFQHFRSGQFFFEKVMVVDQFGQSVEVVNSSTSLQFAPVIAPDMKPVKTVLPQEPQRFVQLKPRLLQPGRLNIDFVSTTDNTQIVDYVAGVSPVCAWILPNHLDHSLMFYDAEGGPLGEMRVVTNDIAQRVPVWTALPGSAYPTIQSLVKDFPNVAQFLQGIVNQGADAFIALMRSIDETLWTIEPTGGRYTENTSVLMGRPIAMVRARVQYGLNAQPFPDPSWQFTFAPAVPQFPTYTFPIMLGKLNVIADGLLGYFSGDDYSVFNAMYVPVSSPYLKQIGKGNYVNLQFQQSSFTYLTLLVDPRAPVHATTDILPVAELEIPARFVSAPLSNINVAFRVGPVITDAQMIPGNPAQLSYFLPQPSIRHGSWLWQEYDGSAWQPYPIVPADGQVRFSNVPSTARTGMLQLTGALKPDDQS